MTVNIFFNLPVSIYKYKRLIASLAKREMATQYIGSLLGIVWAFIHPLVMILVFWFIFSVGFRVKPMNDVPFVVWLTAGMAPWFYFSEIVIGSTSVVLSNSNLVKKMVFPTEILPVVKILASLISHTFFLLILFVLMIFQQLDISFYFFQAVYYLICLWILALALSLLSSALNVFVRDVGHLVAVIMQVGFWGTPIFWDINIMPEWVQFLLKLNPVYYFVQGYRDSFIYFVPFWDHPWQTIYFWVVTTCILCLGMYMFYRLKPQFADVL
jgi:ABC-type polysaccharide/polyol phosphate export permease